MAAILLSDCTVTYNLVAGIKVVKIVTPATADSGDTIDCASLFKNGCVAFCSCATDKTLLSAAGVYSPTITLPGATANEARTIIAIGE
jgi:hypothetical protein